MSKIIEAENITKKYSLYLSPYWYIKNIFAQKKIKKEFYALKNISFSLEKGQTLGVIGVNGSGKSTLLKILAGITFPDTGKLEVKGRVGSLLDLGIGFNPELSGEENIFLNGFLLGIDKKSLEEKMNSIVDFSEIEKSFISQPIKTYSSGMLLRLGFSIAIYTDFDILLIDEILAVGDINFRRKCYEKIEEFKKEGKTIIIVSHDLETIERTCETGIYLSEGRIVKMGEIREVIASYYKDNMELSYSKLTSDELGSGEIEITNIRVFKDNGAESDEFFTNEKIKIAIGYELKKDVSSCQFAVSFWKNDVARIATLNTGQTAFVPIIKKEGSVECTIDSLQLLPGIYAVRAGIYDENNQIPYSVSGWRSQKKFIKVLPIMKNKLLITEKLGILYLEGKWRVILE